jgi:hypothetical protein
MCLKNQKSAYAIVISSRAFVFAFVIHKVTFQFCWGSIAGTRANALRNFLEQPDEREFLSAHGDHETDTHSGKVSTKREANTDSLTISAHRYYDGITN